MYMEGLWGLDSHSNVNHFVYFVDGNNNNSYNGSCLLSPYCVVDTVLSTLHPLPQLILIKPSR